LPPRLPLHIDWYTTVLNPDGDSSDEPAPASAASPSAGQGRDGMSSIKG
jgi:hypothetical protein